MLRTNTDMSINEDTLANSLEAITLVIPASDITIDCTNPSTPQFFDWLNNNGLAVISSDCNPVTWTNDYSASNNYCISNNCTYSNIDFEDFESGWGIWNDGGSDARRRSNDSAYAYSGNYPIRLRDNSGSSNITTDNLNMTSYDSIRVSFTYITRFFSNNEDFWLQISTNGGSSYTTVADFDAGSDFVNNVREFVTVTIPGSFSNNTRLRIRCDASNNSDLLYIDDVLIEGCTISSGMTEVTFTATDNCGSTISTTANISFANGTLPSISLTTSASDLTVECDGLGNIADVSTWLNSNGGAMATDGCTGINWENDFNNVTDLCAETGSVLVTFTANDLCGNSVSTSATFTIDDTQSPSIITTPTNLILTCSDIGNATIIDNWILSNGMGIADDNCGNVTWSNDYNSFNNNCSQIILFTVTDDCGNSTTALAEIIVTDIIDPIITVSATNPSFNCSDVSNPLDSVANWLADNGNAIAADDCGILSWSNDYNGLSGGCGATGTASVIFMVEDICGNTSTSTGVLTVTDSQPPVITQMGTDLILECDSTSNQVAITDWLNLNANALATDDCGILTWSNDYNGLIYNCGYTSNTSVLFTVEDDCGNSLSFSNNIVLEDNTNPQLLGVPNDTVYYCQGEPDIPIIGTDIIVIDGCSDNVDIVFTETSTKDTTNNSCASVIYTLTRTWVATDDCGNSVSETQTINIACECCSNNIDDDNDGLIDDLDPKCPCLAKIFRNSCEDDSLYYYAPPIWKMNDTNYSPPTYTTPSSIVVSSAFGTANISVRTGDGTTFNNTYVVNQGAPVEIPLTSSIIQTDNENTIENDKGLIIKSDKPIQLLYRLAANNNKLLITLKGEYALGRNFRAASQTNVCGAPNVLKKENHFISVMATQDNTTVDFQFPSGLDMFGMGSTHSILLNNNETYLIRDNNTNQSVTGTLITSDKPISVISGSQHSNQCDPNSSGRDGGADQLLPTCVLKNDYIVVRGIDDDNPSTANYAVVVAVVANTNVFIDGGATPVATLQPGESYTYNMPTPDLDPHHIHVSNPAYVFQFGSVQLNGEIGMAILPAIDECAGDNYLEFFNFPNSTENTVTIIIPDSGLSTLTLNGTSYTTYSVAQSVPSLTDWSVVRIDNADFSGLTEPFIIESAEPFSASQFVGNPSGGTFGYLSSFKDKLEFLDSTNTVITDLFIDSLCSALVQNVCLDVQSCAGSNVISSIETTENTGNVIIEQNTTCFDYISKVGFRGTDSIVVRVSNEFGVTESICLYFFVCGGSNEILSLPINDTICDISTFPPYASISELINAGCQIDTLCRIDSSSFTLLNEIEDFMVCPKMVVRQYQISNECGYHSIINDTIIVDDFMVPALTCLPDVSISCNETLPSSINLFADFINEGGSGSDDCSLDTLSFLMSSEFSNSLSCSEIVTRVYEISDNCGNSSSCSQQISILDTMPIIQFPSDTLVACYNDTLPSNVGMPIVNDICNNNPVISYSNSIVSGSCSANYTINRTWNIIDECGLDTIYIQSIQVVDTLSPLMVIAPTDLVLECGIPSIDDSISSWLINYGGLVYNDLCSSFTITDDYTNTNTNTTITCGNSGVTLVTFTISDDCGNTTSTTANIIVEDMTPPTISCPTNLFLECDNDYASEINTWLNNYVANDDCNASVSVTNNYNASNLPNVNCNSSSGYIVTFSAMDACGNTSSCNSEIYVDDTTPPTINCPINIIESTSSGLCINNNLGLGTPTFTDACGISSISNDSPSEFGIGVTPVIWTVSDIGCNTSTCIQTITINDDELPTITCPSDLTVNPDAFSCEANLIVLGMEVSNDNCTGSIVTNDEPVSYTLGTTTVVFTITDSSGNSATCSQEVTVEENELPTINCPDDITVETDPGLCEASFVNLGMPISSDNCSTISNTNDAVEPYAFGLNSVTWTTTDSSGNSSSCVQLITVIDIEAPVIDCPSDLYLTGDSELENLNQLNDWLAVFGNATAVDNCTNVSLSINHTITNISCNTALVGNAEITAIDDYGNSSSCEVDIYTSSNTSNNNTFSGGSAIINMGIEPQTYDNGLKPYGLIYELTEASIPVNWIIKSDKMLNEVDFVVDGIAYKSGAFIIPSEIILSNSAVQQIIDKWISEGVIVNYASSDFKAPLYKVIKSFPKVIMDEDNGSIMNDVFYEKALIPLSAVTFGLPGNITECEEVYVMPHADPHKWELSDVVYLKTFIDNGGHLWAGCHAISALETYTNSQMEDACISEFNLLSKNGLIPWSEESGCNIDAHDNKNNPPFAYDSIQGRSSVFQFLGNMDGAYEGGSEKIMIPKADGWRAATQILVQDTMHELVGTGNVSPGPAALVAYGPAYGDPSMGNILYQASHSISTGNEQEDVSAARLFGNFLLETSTAGASELEVCASILPEVINCGIEIPLTADVISTPGYTVQWNTNCPGTIVNPDSTNTSFIPSEANTGPCYIRIETTNSCGRKDYNTQI
ncbi:MAG: HYR domain-containing protein, partial [Bacteroidia bacterium]|nr:HYR domain-containing protein [Bacteroidia bacterium]